MTLGDDLDLLLDTDFRLRMGSPELVPTERELATVSAELVDAYTDYVQTVSEAEHAVSLQTAAYLLFLCRTQEAERVLDLGSGFSSYVLQHYADTAPYPVTAYHVDTDPVWGERTTAFAERYGVAVRVESWSDFIGIVHGPFDIVFHDLAGGDTRNETMPYASSLVMWGGLIVFDDCHHDGHRDNARAVCARDGLQWFSLHRQTSDTFSRFAAIGVKA